MKEENFDFKDFILLLTIVIIFILLFANFYKNLILKQEKINILRNINNITTNSTIIIDQTNKREKFMLKKIRAVQYY